MCVYNQAFRACLISDQVCLLHLAGPLLRLVLFQVACLLYPEGVDHRLLTF